MPPFLAKVPASTRTKENEMKNLKTYAVAAILAGAFALPLASANAAGNSGTTSGASASAGTGAITSQTFKSLDADRSGTLSKSEFEKYSGTTANFDKADANGDGNLTLSEAQTVSSSGTSSGMSGSGNTQ
jgi:hypothetical protein